GVKGVGISASAGESERVTVGCGRSDGLQNGPNMGYLRILALLGICLGSASFAHAQRVIVGIGVGPAYVGPAPVCAYGYYGYYPYACAPYGYSGPECVIGGLFIDASPSCNAR